MTPFEYDYLRGFLKQRSGLVLSNEKQYLIESRLLPVARKASLPSISALVAKMKEPGAGVLCDAVVEAMTTNESFFFRDKVPFEHFTNTMLPAMLDARARDRRLRIWCAAASTGQEPYSLAMCLKEAEARLAGWRIEIIGTDLSNEVLEKARAGVYSQFEVQRGLPINHLLKHFVQNGDTWQISSTLRGMVQYRKLNLLENFSSLGQFDIVFCRNVLIYFDNQTKIDILGRIAKMLPADGFLVLGAAETVVGLTDAFKPMTDKRGLYQTAAAGAAPSTQRYGTTGAATPAPAPTPYTRLATVR
ncbi:protein-glutamate O-methyltransferase CheR [Siculibacillus lacustris]|uniref:protein-glutamate O-methyltransferase n=1 Tax=Siculibacillus lacustris TaxID=1549641 RepID=A0A4Q9VQ47_9HYPH|nr:protein-glutamate O-methyltransferase CheR [Siculibacillus lacustris]TBW37380.1 protein-glutamate O-methyltransferase CheR [Siculibacillus lacustris]